MTPAILADKIHHLIEQHKRATHTPAFKIDLLELLITAIPRYDCDSQRIIKWLKTSKPAVTAFTESAERQLGFAIEAKLNKWNKND